MIHLASKVSLRPLRWMPHPLFRAVIASCLLFDSVLSTVWAPLRAIGHGVLCGVVELLEGLAEPWRFWIPCRCVHWDNFKRSLPSRDGEEIENDPCEHCGGRGGFGLWAACGMAATKIQEKG